jgi:hypothetical protein
MHENEIIIFLEWSMDDHTKDSKKSPIYQFWLFITEFFLSNLKYATKLGLRVVIPY